MLFHHSCFYHEAQCAFPLTLFNPPAPSQPPGKVMWNTSNSKIIVNWEQVKALENESEVTGYKVRLALLAFRGFSICCHGYQTTLTIPPRRLQVLYKRNRHSPANVMETNTTSVELSLPTDEEYIIQIKPFGEGGEGSSSRQITIPRIAGQWHSTQRHHR